MPEDAAPSAEGLAAEIDSQDTPEAPGNEAPQGTPSESPAHDWEQRYNSLRSEFDSRNQRYSQYEQFVQNLSNPETQAEALRALGLEIEDDDLPDDDYDDPEDRWEQRFNQIEGYLSQQAAEAQQREIADLESQYLDQELKGIEKDENVKLSAKEKEAVESLGHKLRDEDGVPDYQQAYKLLAEAADARQARYRESKKSEVPGLGQAGEETIDLSDDDARVKLMADMLEAGRD